MANNDSSPVKFFSTTETAFYFEVAGTDIDEDAFDAAAQPIRQHLIHSNDNKLLILNEDQFQAQNLTTAQQRQPDCKFNIKIYNNSLGNRQRRAVMLYVNKDGKKMVVCCNEKHEIYPEEMDLPKRIEESAHKAVFYQKSTVSKCLLESSVYPTEFLGFEPDGNDHTLSKLVLRHIGERESNEYCEVFFSQCSE
ncbi:uncharacterized protein LOC143323610 isoform X2 [Chaetodon auriga]|uniref:uncharacterized protein LOC143323610 isoform X2 n=1 Tax=Chaetodon auriga TaxID=39042 RepID=UPI004032CF2E